MRLFILLCFFALSAFAQEIPPASDFDFSPEEVFTNITNTTTHYSENRNIETDFKLDLKLSYHNVVEWKTSTAFDWSVLNELNIRGSELWKQLIAASGSVEKTKSNYIKGYFPKQLVGEYKDFRASVAAYLSTVEISEFDLIDFSKCLKYHNIVGCSDVFPSWVNDMIIPHIPNQKESDSLGFPFLLLSALPEQTYSPLLLQALLEHIAVGYPVNYGLNLCKGGMLLRCALGGGGKMIWESEFVEYTTRGLNDNKEELAKLKTIIDAATALDQWGKVPQSQSSPQFQLKFNLIRRANAAVRLMKYIMPGVKQCDAYGLYPDRSVELIGALAQSSYRILHNEYEGKHMNLLAAQMSEVCKLPIAYSMIRPGARENAVSAIAKIGAWRELYRRQVKP